jgi:predicted RNase H-like HicB family nuclease
MKKIIQTHIYKGEKYYIAECLDLPVVTQGKTLDELVINLKEAIALTLEGENPADFDLSVNPSILMNFEVDSSSVYAKA